jgi:hypothetical protein
MTTKLQKQNIIYTRWTRSQIRIYKSQQHEMIDKPLNNKFSFVLSKYLTPWEAVSRKFSREIPYPSQDTKIHYRFHKNPANTPILSKMSPLHNPNCMSLRFIPVLSSYLSLGLQVFSSLLVSQRIISPNFISVPWGVHARPGHSLTHFCPLWFKMRNIIRKIRSQGPLERSKRRWG